MKGRTLTARYNANPQWLQNAHAALNRAIYSVYDWPLDISDDTILENLLTENLARAGAQVAVPPDESELISDDGELDDEDWLSVATVRSFPAAGLVPSVRHGGAPVAPLLAGRWVDWPNVAQVALAGLKAVPLAVLMYARTSLELYCAERQRQRRQTYWTLREPNRHITVGIGVV